MVGAGPEAEPIRPAATRRMSGDGEWARDAQNVQRCAKCAALRIVVTDERNSHRRGKSELVNLLETDSPVRGFVSLGR